MGLQLVLDCLVRIFCLDFADRVDKAAELVETSITRANTAWSTAGALTPAARRDQRLRRFRNETRALSRSWLSVSIGHSRSPLQAHIICCLNGSSSRDDRRRRLVERRQDEITAEDR